MRTVLMGNDFMYNSAGNLIPIELNTNAEMDYYQIEDHDTVFNLTELSTFITLNNFTKVTYVGGLTLLSDNLSSLCITKGIIYDFIPIYTGTIIPYIEDSDDHLIIRSAYDDTAIVDSEYCKNKINFLNLIKTQSYSSQFAYLDENGVLVSNITIKDNGTHPNLILKHIFPSYDKKIYPKLYKVTTQSELDSVLSLVTNDMFLMEYHYNPNKLYMDHIILVRSYNLLFPPDLNNMTLGEYTKITTRKIDELSTYDVNTFELTENREKYLISGINTIRGPKILDSDQIEMADGTFKSGLDIQVNDIVKTIDIANPNNVNMSNPTVDFHIDYNTFISGTTYSTNKIVEKSRIDMFIYYTLITFTDNTTWEDTINTSYLILRDNDVRFVYLKVDDTDDTMKIGDNVILINSSDEQLNVVLKEVSSIVVTKELFGGWVLNVEEEHLFLTKSEDSTSSFVAVEHNSNCTNLCSPDECGGFGKGWICCDYDCADYCGSC